MLIIKKEKRNPSQQTTLGPSIDNPKLCRENHQVIDSRRRKRCGFDPCVGKIPWSRKWQPTPVPRESPPPVLQETPTSTCSLLSPLICNYY